jgi:small subunit ribosomal protein S24e
MEKMRNTRATLPVSTQSKDVLTHISMNEVTICMAATGSGKTTQIPQMILDDYINRGEGAQCNIICTQPRRLAAISVAHRVANERGEQIGRSVGYHVRFESKLPEPHGSITFCTTGVFLKRLQSFLSDERGREEFNNISHIIVDEVHERDVDTDLLLVVLKHLLAQKKANNQPLKIVLMSATIDPTLFQKYFADEQGVPANTIDVPGRSFPVTKYFMDDFASSVLSGPMSWLKNQEIVAKYLVRELGSATAAQLGVRVSSGVVETRDDLDLPYPLVAAMISHVLQNSEDGHVLVFLPGWDEIVTTQRAILSPQGPLGVNLSSPKYSLHLLHSSIPLSEQQAIFEPPGKGVRRIILATNIAETSVTIPDVVYVIDTAKIKEQRYDPHSHMSSLVSSWVGSSNLNQRAGRAGRHRSGEYYGILGKARAEALHIHQMVEMKRVDLSNVVMHVKALNFPGMTVEEVLAAAIEPPDPGRVNAAMKNLQMVGALDSERNLTSLGRVLLQLPVDAQVGKMVLYGSFFRCLDQALTLAAILTNREPFMSPMHVRVEAQRVKNSWSPENFRSDALATLNAYNTWWSMQSRGDYFAANRFCSENFLSKPTLLLIQKVRYHLLQALYRAGVINISAGGEAVVENRRRRDGDDEYDERRLVVPDALNTNKDSMPLLTALISIAAQPKFAIRKDKQSFRTATDKVSNSIS